MENKQSATKLAKAYLLQIRKTDQIVQRLLEARFSLRSSLYSTGAPLSGMPRGSHDPDRTGKTIARLDELERRIDAYVDELVTRKAEAFARICLLSELAEQDVLIARYIQLKPWPVIAREMHYEERQVYRIHGNALQHFESVLAQTCQ